MTTGIIDDYDSARWERLFAIALLCAGLICTATTSFGTFRAAALMSNEPYDPILVTAPPHSLMKLLDAAEDELWPRLITHSRNAHFRDIANLCRSRVNKDQRGARWTPHL